MHKTPILENYDNFPKVCQRIMCPTVIKKKKNVTAQENTYK